MTILGYIAKSKRSLGLAFRGHFVHDCSMKMFHIYSINGQGFSVTRSYLLLKISNKMCY